jgi:multidrug efflux pump subunit AcrA (membrane-fusion protein)
MPDANTFMPQIRLLLLVTPLLLTLLFTTGRAAEAPIRLTDVQRMRAGVTVVGVRAAGLPASDAAGPGGIRLGGRAVVPNEALDLILAGVSGRLESVAVQAGQQVRAGAPLGEIFSTELLGAQRAWLGARGAADLAAARLARETELLAAGVIAASRLEATRADAIVASAAVREHRQLLRLAGMTDADITALRSADAMNARVTVRARRAGVLLEQLAEVGEAVGVGEPLFRLGTLETLWVELQATPEQARRIAPGDTVALIGCEASGVMLATGAQLLASTQTVALRAAFSSAGACLLPNQYVEVSVRSTRGAADAVAAPQGAVVQREGRDYVFVATDAGFVPTVVTVVDAQGAEKWLLGLEPGQRIAVGGIATLKGAWLGLGPEAP